MDSEVLPNFFENESFVSNGKTHECTAPLKSFCHGDGQVGFQESVAPPNESYFGCFIPLKYLDMSGKTNAHGFKRNKKIDEREEYNVVSCHAKNGTKLELKSQ